MRFADRPEHRLGHACRGGIHHPGAEQRVRRRRFPSLLESHGLAIADLSKPRPVAGTYVLVGVAIGWSSYDWRLLDDIAAAVRAQTGDKAEFFDFSEMMSQEQLDAAFPGIGPVFHSPAVGIWTDGHPVAVASGYAARQLLRLRYLGVDEKGARS